MEEMGLPVTLKPNITDLSCTFQFGIHPLPVAQDDSIVNSGCLSTCLNKRVDSKCIVSVNHNY